LVLEGKDETSVNDDFFERAFLTFAKRYNLPLAEAQEYFKPYIKTAQQLKKLALTNSFISTPL
jgi:hypothetical protein